MLIFYRALTFQPNVLFLTPTIKNNMNKVLLTLLALPILILSMCSHTEEKPASAAGKLVIIGGGDKPDIVMNKMVDLAGLKQGGYMFVLPMASGVPDSALIWAREDFGGTGLTKVPGYYFKKGEPFPQDKIDSLRNAKLIFISGGDQSRFMDAVTGTPILAAIREAYENGAVIAGTSAGAAVMSRKMITGNQLRYPDSDRGFITIESQNVEIRDGLGFLQDVIIDQHFIKRQRLNRLIAVSLENPEQLCVGIDESTAIVVEGDFATVVGISQVVVIKNKSDNIRTRDSLLGAEGIEVSVYLPGERFQLR
jgi:cyanophycinase